eukprot:gnl/TRDRNA2_/TRDRNA2_164690_c0_seq1.p1 gnl/TRDRNA2_/TRDRNA2_164690_c0~~gnl/TRDRNA2_/TRDRNA2_164690_c0_seq1.p1  ORF type:complete len:190 (-),score=34.10 gnl/TRDRNA2_/TRDRNA2_164690_c0_seq1:345-914(-)
MQKKMAAASVGLNEPFGFKGDVDWIIVGLKSYALDDLFGLVKPLLDSNGQLPPTAKMLAVMNGMGVEQRISELGKSVGLAPANILGGMAFMCCNRGEEGSATVHHLKYGALTIGSHVDDAALLEEAKTLFHDSKVPLALATCLQRARYEKLCWNLPFNGIATALGGKLLIVCHSMAWTRLSEVLTCALW